MVTDYGLRAGEGTNAIATSNDGIVWVGRGNSTFSTSTCVSYGNLAAGSVKWVATGYGTGNTIAYSYNGTTWNGAGIGVFSGTGRGVAFNTSLSL